MDGRLVQLRPGQTRGLEATSATCGETSSAPPGHAEKERWNRGKLTAIVKSQPVPKNNKAPVKIVVGKTFDQIVMDPKKDVLLEFYAPWCGHCKSLEPIYTDLAKKYNGEENLVIAKMDATANDIPHNKYKAEGFPTIYFAPQDKKETPIKFESGERDLETLSKFVEEHATKLSRRKEEL